jgi:hypothetical protein
MAGARLGKAGGLLVASLTLVLVTATGGQSACNTTCERDIARCMATQCAGVPRAACRRRCKPAVIRTLAYVVSECREDAAGMELTGSQALRVRRGDGDPITVVEFGPTAPQPDPQGLCRLYGESRNGPASMAVGVLQRLGVSPDGSGIVFEVNQDFSIQSPPSSSRLSPEQEGMFFVRSDGHGERRLGPASRDPAFSLTLDPNLPTGMVLGDTPWVPFSPSGRRIAFTDRGPGPNGEDAVQIVVLDLATDPPTRTQVTHLPSAPPPPVCFNCPVTGFQSFLDNETIAFLTLVDGNYVTYKVRIDGSGLKRLPIPPLGAGGRVVPVFGIARLTNLFTLNRPGNPLNGIPGLNPISELFVQGGKNLVQLTNFQYVDTNAWFLDHSRTRAFFMASADPLGVNPHGNCQIFSIGTLGSGLRQLTHVNPGGSVGPSPSCWDQVPPSCSFGFGGVFQDPVTNTLVFNSQCDLLHANPLGDQVFAMRPDGLGLRQLTDVAGYTSNPDGSIRVELAGPFAYSAH